MSKPLRIRTILQSPPGRAALYAIAIALAATGCAHAAAQPDDGASTRKAVLDFNSCAKPVYPQADIQAGHEGTVTLSFLVKEDGSVGASKVLGSSGFVGMDEAARTALAKCQFQPALARGKAIKKWTKVAYVWKLK